MPFLVYRIQGGTRDLVAGPFPDQATADSNAQALAANCGPPTYFEVIQDGGPAPTDAWVAPDPEANTGGAVAAPDPTIT
jgi:hypothetical protein